jgi:hypothetical protein
LGDSVVALDIISRRPCPVGGIRRVSHGLFVEIDNRKVACTGIEA